MKNKKIFMFTLLVMTALLSACGKKEAETETIKESQTETIRPETGSTADDTAESETRMTIKDGSDVKIGSLKGATSMGLVSLMDKSDKGETVQNYDFEMVVAADELVAKVINNDVDIALVPANIASVLYNKTSGNITVLNINTLGVLYIVENGEVIQSVDDLKGKTIYLTGKGTVPDYAINYLLSQHGLTSEDVTLEYKSEPAEVAAILAESEDALGLLPQPFVSAALAQNDKLRIALDLTAEWEALQGEGGSQFVTGVTIVRNDFLKENEDLIKDFMIEYEASTKFTNTNIDEAAEMVAELGIVANAQIAARAIPYCNITFIEGEAMKSALGGYLEVLFGQNPEAVGGELPAEDFYYMQ